MSRWWLSRCSPLALLCIAIASCAPAFDVRTDFDSNADLSAPKSYDWAPRAAGNVTGLLEARLKGAIESQLQAKGFTPASDAASAQLLVHYHVVIEEKMSMYDSGYSPVFGRQVTVDQYKEGTLVIDVIDAARKQVVWRGSASGVVSESQPGSNIDPAVAQIMASFPPRPKD